jgi:hypothetical protein
MGDNNKLMSSINWTFKVIVIIRAADAAAINAAIVSQFNNDANENHTFEAVQLSTTGNLPVQAYAASTAAKPGYKDALLNLKNAKPNSRIYVLDADTDILVATNSVPAQANIGQVWTFENVLSDLSLKLIQPVLV